MNASAGCKQNLKYISAKLSVKCKCQRIQKECRSRLTSLTKNVYNEKQVKDEGAVRMSDVYATINYVLVNLINEIWEVEGKAIITDEFKDITNNDMHVIEAIGLGEGNNMSTIAKKLNITVGSLTTAVNSLVKKGYVDRRVVYVRLLEKGEKAYHHHEDYHKQMTQAIVDKLDESEITVLLKTLDALTGFFIDYTRESKEKSSDSMDKE